MQAEVTKKRFTVEEYYQMDEAGILAADVHTELVDGEIIEVMEIADSWLTYDRDITLKIYAAANVPEVWIADLRGDSLLVFRDPSTSTYKTSLSFNRDASISCLAFPDIEFSVQELLA